MPLNHSHYQFRLPNAVTGEPRHNPADHSPNFVSEKLTIGSTEKRGFEVLATQDIKKGEVLVVYGGGFIHREHLYLVPPEMRPFFFQVADGIWFGHGLDEKGVGIAERIDHSCSPSAGFRGIAEVIALRDIRSGEPITLDYSSMQTEELDGSTFGCACGSDGCRQRVSVDDWRKISASDPLVQHMQPFIQARIGRDVSNEAASFSEISFPDRWYSPQVNGELQSTLISRSVELRRDGRARARAPICEGEVVLMASGRIVHRSVLQQSDDLPSPLFRPIAQDFFVGPRSPSDITPRQIAQVEDSQANIGLRLGHLFVATRAINIGDEIILHSERSTLISIRQPENGATQDSMAGLKLASPKPLGALPTTTLPSTPREGHSPSDQLYRAVSKEISQASVNEHSDLSTSMRAALLRTTRQVISATGSFVKGALVEDWMAAPIAFAGSMTATFATALSVASLAPIFERIFNSTTSPGYVFATSTTAIVLGYASYCLFYWAGMLWKDRAELRDESGAFSRERLEEKLKVFMWDFLLHLPSDAYWVGAMFGVQGGLYASGSADLFWSIIVSQGVSDIYYSLREPFYWRAAKNTAATLTPRRSSMGTDVANSDVIPPSSDREVANG